MNRVTHTPAHAAADLCLVRDSSLLALAQPDAAGILERRSNLSGWYRYWFSLSGSQLLYFERTQSGRRGLLAGTISLFRHTLTVVNSVKRRREFEILDAAGKLHVLRPDTDLELHWWLQVFVVARNKIPPAKPIASAVAPPSPDAASLPDTAVGSHLKVDHVLCVVHGIGVSPEILAANITQLRDSYDEIMHRVFPDIHFRVEMLVTRWRSALTRLDVHKRLQAVVPRDPVGDEANPLRQFMVHRIVDYVYYTHARYRRHILREVASQLNEQIDSFRRRRPDFDGKISIMGHSLGAALCYDLMCRKVTDDQVLLKSEGIRLNFDAVNLFCVGNPLGTFLSLDPTIGNGADMRKMPFRVFNLFKSQDPIATRLEPLWDVNDANVPAVMVPCWFNMGLRETTSQWLGGLWPGQKKKEEDADDNGSSSSKSTGGSGSPRSLKGAENGRQEDRGNRIAEKGGWSPLTAAGVSGQLFGDQSMEDVAESQEEERGTQMDAGTRFDFELQMSSTMEEMSTSWSALKAHTNYWGNRDAMLMLVSRMARSTFGDEVDEGVAAAMEQRVIDADVAHKRGTEWMKKVAAEKPETPGMLEVAVRQVVDRVIDEAAATYELVRLHPQVRARPGGVAGCSPAVSQVHDADADADADAGGWASYLRAGWFGGGQAAHAGASS